MATERDPDPAEDQANITLISSDGKCFTLLRTVTEKNSEYFRALLSSGMLESQEGLVQLQAISSEHLHFVVNFLEGKSHSFEMDCIEGILETATYLQIPSLIEKCVNFITQHIDEQNVKDLITLGERLASQELVQAAKDFLHSHIVAFSNTLSFLRMDLGEVCQLLRRDEIRVVEREICQAAIKWYEFSKTERLPFMKELVDSIRFCLMTTEELSSLTQFIQAGCPDIMHLFREEVEIAQRYHSDPCLIHVYKI